MKIVYLDSETIGNASLAEIEALGELVCYPTSTKEEALGRVSDCEVLIVNKVVVDAELMDHAPKLRLICESATGVNNIDVAEAGRRGIPVKNVAAYSTYSVLQLTWMQILSLLGNGPFYDAEVKDGSYSAFSIFTDATHPFTELAGKTIGIIGMGNIGMKVAAVAEAFGMKVVYYSTSGTSHCTQYPSLEIQDLLAVSDVVSIHAPLNDRTKGLIGEKELAMMKPTAILVNMGRGTIVDEAALAAAVDNGVIAGAALDVYAVEPLPASSPLLSVAHPERLRLTPHVAWASQEALDRLVAGVAANIRNFA